MVLWCQGGKVWKGVSIRHVQNKQQTWENEKAISKDFYESWFYLQKLTLGTTSMLQAQINWGKHHYVIMQISKTLRGKEKKSQLPRVHLSKLFYFQLERIYWNACMRVARSLFFFLEFTGPRGDILPLKFRIHEWSVAQQKISQTESQVPGIFHIGFYIKFVKLE